MKRSITVAALAAATLIGTAAGANAATIDAAGKGFVGKGEVQSAFGLSNGPMQTAVDKGEFSFKSEQPTTQSLKQRIEQAGTQSGSQIVTQAMTQAATQSGTQVVEQELTCTFTNGNGTKVFHREGVRDAERTGTREGSRVGTREGVRTGDRDGTRNGTQSGKQVGNLASVLAVTDKKTGQYTGFNLKGFVAGTSVYTEVGAPVWDAPSYGAWDFGTYTFGAASYGDATFDGDFTFGEYTYAPVDATAWGEWDALPGENPDDCLRSQNADKITQISNVITPGSTTDGAIEVVGTTEGAVTVGATTDGAINEGGITVTTGSGGEVVADGLAKVLVTWSRTGVTKTLSPTPAL